MNRMVTIHSNVLQRDAILGADRAHALEGNGDDAGEDENEERHVERFAAGRVGFEDDLVELGSR